LALPIWAIRDLWLAGCRLGWLKFNDLDPPAASAALSLQRSNSYLGDQLVLCEEFMLPRLPTGLRWG
jgi:hypothetical protein